MVSPLIVMIVTLFSLILDFFSREGCYHCYWRGEGKGREGKGREGKGRERAEAEAGAG